MNNKSLWLLSKLYVQRNRATKKITVLLTISFILLFFTIWTLFGFYGYVLGAMQSDNDSLMIYFEKNADINQYGEISQFLGDFDTIDSCGIRFGNIENTISEEIYAINGNELALSKKVTEYDGIRNTNNVNYSDNTLSNVVNYLTGIQILHDDIDSSNSIMKKMSITGASFDDNAKGQILVSNRFLEFSNTTASEILNKQLSLKLKYNNLNMYKNKLDDDIVVGNEVQNKYEELSVDIFKNFSVVGVFQDNWLEYNYDCDFIISEQSVNFDNLPTIYDGVYTYNQADYEILSQNITASGELFPFMLNNTYITPWIAGITGNAIITYPPALQTIQLKDARNAIQLSEMLDDLYAVSAFKSEMISIVNFYHIINKYFGIIALIVTTLFGVVLLNIYNINAFSKKEKEKSFYLYRAMGLKNKNVCRLDFYQNVRIFGKSLGIATIAITACILALMLVVFAVNKFNISKYIWQFIAVAPLAIVALSFIALFCSFVFSKKYIFIKKKERK